MLYSMQHLIIPKTAAVTRDSRRDEACSYCNINHVCDRQDTVLAQFATGLTVLTSMRARHYKVNHKFRSLRFQI
jgi:hypothetical protein